MEKLIKFSLPKLFLLLSNKNSSLNLCCKKKNLFDYSVSTVKKVKHHHLPKPQPQPPLFKPPPDHSITNFSHHFRFNSLFSGRRSQYVVTKAQLPERRVRAFGYTWWCEWESYMPVTPIIVGLGAVNGAVYCLWRNADPAFMAKHFTVSVDNLTSGRFHTLITCAFSHMEFEHLMDNMKGLLFFGLTLGQTLGPEFVFKMYLAGAISGSIFYLIHQAFMASSSSSKGVSAGLRNGIYGPFTFPGLGANGAVSAIILLDIFLFPKAVLIWYIIPFPAMLLGARIIGTEILKVKEGEIQIWGSALLGGAVVAVLAWARIKKGWI